jgi:glyoxylase-like metal-dependent hydrolase (beta-lactamase superfamily II)
VVHFSGNVKIVQVGGRTAVVSHAENAHTDGDSYVYFPDANVLATGDIFAAGHAGATLWACRPCVEARGLAASSLDHRIKLGGMNEFHVAARAAESRVIAF